MNNMWLIQRGKWNSNITEEDAKYTIIYGNNGLINLDYMGSAEFEWGALPNSLTRIFDNFNDYDYFVTDICNRNSVPFVLFCPKDKWHDYVDEIKRFIDTKYRLKGRTGLFEHFYSHEQCKNMIYSHTSFWWNVENSAEDVAGDWMGFFGAVDRMKCFRNSIKYTYNTLWVSLSEKEQEEKRRKAYTSGY